MGAGELSSWLAEKTGWVILVLAPRQPLFSQGCAGCALQSVSCSEKQEHLCKGRGDGQLRGLGASPGKGATSQLSFTISTPAMGGETAGWHGRAPQAVFEAGQLARPEQALT